MMATQTNGTTHNPEPAEALPALPEAPASVTVKFLLRGYDTRLTLRGHSGAEVIPRLMSAINYLEEHGAEATPAGRASSPAPAANGRPEEKICSTHSAKMKLRTGQGGDSWYSHKAFKPDGSEYWCRGE